MFFQSAFKWVAVWLIGLFFVVQAVAQSESPSDDIFLAELQRRSAPVIRSCIVNEFKQLGPYELSSKAPFHRDVGESEEVAKAEFVVRYLGETCFSALETDPPPEDGNPWRSPRSIVLALQNHALMKSYDSGELRAVVDAYNVHQDCLFGLLKRCATADATGRLAPVKNSEQREPDHTEWQDWVPPPRGHSKIRLMETEGLFLLAFTLTDQSHSTGVDAGIDRFKTVIFSRADMSVMADNDALYLELPQRSHGLLSVGAQDSCSGKGYGDHLIMIDGAAREVGRVRLPEGVREIESQPLNGKGRFQLRVRGQTLVADEREESCELPYWAKHFEYRYSFYCNDPGKKCRVEKRLIRTYQGCADIGGCD